MDDIESEQRCGHVPWAERRGHARSGQSGQRVRGAVRLRARVWARVRARRKPSQDGAGAAVLGSVASSSPARSGRTEETKSRVLAAAGRAPLGELRRIESWSRAEFVAHGVEETGSPGKCACVRGGSAGVVVCVRSCAYKWRCTSSVNL